MRGFALSLLAMALFAPLAWACDLYPTTRPSDVTGYVANASACLEAPPSPVSFDAAAEAEMAASINAARRAEGLPALDVRTDLRPAARFHSLDQIWNGTFGHTGAAGRDQGARISALDRTLVRSFSAENVAQARGDYNPAILPNLLHNGLMESPGHRKNILAEDATHMAIGVARLRDAFVVTQLFVRVEGAFQRPIPTGFDAMLGPANVELVDWSAHALHSTPSATQDLLACFTECPDTTVSVVEVEGRKPLTAEGGYRIIRLYGPSWDTPRPGPDAATHAETPHLGTEMP
ncbi:MAG: CAP domain-containing protein [Pseudomonadota bacterium]